MTDQLKTERILVPLLAQCRYDPEGISILDSLSELDWSALTFSKLLSQFLGGAEITVVAPESSGGELKLRRALAAGADRGIVLSVAENDLSDSLQLSALLTALIQAENAGYVICPESQPPLVAAINPLQLAGMLRWDASIVTSSAVSSREHCERPLKPNQVIAIRSDHPGITNLVAAEKLQCCDIVAAQSKPLSRFVPAQNVLLQPATRTILGIVRKDNCHNCATVEEFADNFVTTLRAR